MPVIFAPVVLRTFPGRCTSTMPNWIERARSDAAAPPILKAYAIALTHYRDGSMSYIKLLDGGRFVCGLLIALRGKRGNSADFDRFATSVDHIVDSSDRRGRVASGDCRLGQVSSAAAGRCQWRPARIQLVRGWEGGPQVGCVMYGQPAKNFLSLNVQSRDCYLALVVVRHGLMGSRHR